MAKMYYTKRDVDRLLSTISTSGGGSYDFSLIAAASGYWNNTTNQVNLSSPLWNSVYSQVCALSSSWIGGGSDISTLSANWQSTYLTVNANSAIQWNYQGNDLKPLSANWQSTYTTVCAISSNWQSSYTIVGETSAKLYSVYNTVSTLSGTWNDTTTYFNNSSPIWNLTYTHVKGLSDNWGGALAPKLDSVYNTVSTLSGTWNNTTSYFTASSPLWNNVYTTVLASSAGWGGTIYTGQYERSFILGDWGGFGGPYTIVIPAATHGQGATKNLSVTVKQDFGSDNIIVYDSPSINDNGTVTITTNTRYEGSVVIGKLGGLNNADVTNAKKGQITCIFEGAGSVLATGLKTYVKIENDAVIEAWTATGDGNIGSIVVDVWKCPYANFPPTVTDTIAGSGKPTITSAKMNTDNNLTSWVTQISADDYIGFNVDSCSTFQRATVTLKISKG